MTNGFRALCLIYLLHWEGPRAAAETTMRLTLHTDFSLRVLIQVGLNDSKLTRINDIAQSFPALIRKAGRPSGLSTLAALAIQDDRAS
jgi:hypothetical protein